MKILHYIGKAIQVLAIVMLALVLAGNLYLLAVNAWMGVPQPMTFGYSTAVVVSGSMEPALSVDDVIVIRAQKDYAPGDIITFYSDGMLVTHRIVDQEAGGYRTQGDANNAADADLVAPEDVVGKVVLRVPHLGTLLGLLRTPLGMTVLVAVLLLLLGVPLLMQRKPNAAMEKGDEHGA